MSSRFIQPLPRSDPRSTRQGMEVKLAGRPSVGSDSKGLPSPWSSRTRSNVHARSTPSELSALTDKFLVETEGLVEVGKSHGVLEDLGSNGAPNFVKLEGRRFYRVCAPAPGQTNHATGAVFWEKEDDDDFTPTGDKIVSQLSFGFLHIAQSSMAFRDYQLGAVVYSPDLINKAFSPDEYSEIEILMGQELLL